MVSTLRRSRRLDSTAGATSSTPSATGTPNTKHPNTLGTGTKKSLRKRKPSEKMRQYEADSIAKSQNRSKKRNDQVNWVACNTCNEWQELPPNVKAEDLADNSWNCSMINWNNPTSEPCLSQSVTNGTSKRHHEMEGTRLFGDDFSILRGSFDEAARRLNASDENRDDGENSRSANEERETSKKDEDEEDSPDNESFVPGSLKDIVKEVDQKLHQQLQDVLKSDSPQKNKGSSDNTYNDPDDDDDNDDDDEGEDNLEKLKKELKDADTSLVRKYLENNEEGKEEEKDGNNNDDSYPTGGGEFPTNDDVSHDEEHDKNNNSNNNNNGDSKAKEKLKTVILPIDINTLNENELEAIDNKLEHNCLKRFRNGKGCYPLKSITVDTRRSLAILKGSVDGKSREDLWMRHSLLDLATFWTLRGDPDQRLRVPLPSQCFELAYNNKRDEFMSYAKLVTNYENMFCYKFIDITVWHGVHYSKAFVVNPEMALHPESSDTESFSGILYCNSGELSGVHTKEKVALTIIKMLNWVREDLNLGNGLFDGTNLIAYNLDVPNQSDTWSCGVRTILASDSLTVSLLNKKNITTVDCEDAFKSYSETFMRYDESDILKIRRDLHTIVGGISSLGERITTLKKAVPNESNTITFDDDDDDDDDDNHKKDGDLFDDKIDDEEKNDNVKEENKTKCKRGPIKCAKCGAPKKGHKCPGKKLPGPLILRCHKSRKEHMDHPTKYKKLFPPDNWCETVEKFEEWVGMTKEEQKVKQSEFRGLSKQVRNKFKQKVPGETVEGCLCQGCLGRRKTRVDKSKKRKRSKSASTRKKNDEPIAKYVSLGLGVDERKKQIKESEPRDANIKRRKLGRDKFSAGDNPKNPSQSFDHKSQIALDNTLTMFQKFLIATALQDEQDTNVPRVRAALIIESEVTEANPNGGPRKPEDVRRDKPILYRMSYNKPDFAHCLSVFTNPEKNWRDGREVIDLLGADQDSMEGVKKLIQKRRELRSRKMRIASDKSHIIGSDIDRKLYSSAENQTKKSTKRPDRPSKKDMVSRIISLNQDNSKLRSQIEERDRINPSRIQVLEQKWEEANRVAEQLKIQINTAKDLARSALITNEHRSIELHHQLDEILIPKDGTSDIQTEEGK